MDPSLYVILNRTAARGRDLEEILDATIAGGCRLVQLRETVLEGVKTSIPFHLRLLDDPAFQEGHVNKIEMVRRRG